MYVKMLGIKKSDHFHFPNFIDITFVTKKIKNIYS